VTFLSVAPGLLASPIGGALLDRHGRTRLIVLDYAIAGVTLALIAALAFTASIFAVATLVAMGIRDPGGRTEAGNLLRDAWRGLVYVARHATLRPLALAVTTANLGSGIFFLALPVLVLTRFGAGAEFVGLLFALAGVSGSISVLLMGRISTLGRERQLLAGAMLGTAACFAFVLLFPQPLLVAVAMLAWGIATGPFDVVLFTIRQRRTDPAWLGRAFAVSMALNFAGFPIGSAIAGAVVPVSIELAFGLAVAATIAGAALAYAGIPERDAPASVS